MNAITCPKYALLQRKYGQWASWAIWDPTDITNLSPISKCPITYTYSDGSLAHYRNDLVIVGLNAVKATSAWQNFHCSYRGCRDHYLAAAFNNPGTGGAYMTDLIKDLPVVDSGKVLEKLKDEDFLQSQINTFCSELDDLWSGTTFTDCPPGIILLGRRACTLYGKYFKFCKAVNHYKPKVICVPHHAGRISKGIYVEKVSATLKPWLESCC